MSRLQKYSPYVVLPAGLILLMLVWRYFQSDTAPANDWTTPKQAPQVSGMPKVKIHPPKIIALAPAAKQKLKLPAAVQADPNQHALAAVVVSADDHPQLIVPVLDTQTGGVQIYFEPQPLPWLDTKQRGYVRVGAGVKNGWQQVGRLAGAFNLVQVKAVDFGFDGTLDTDAQMYAGIHLEIKL